MRFSKTWRQTYVRRCGHDGWSSNVRIHSAVCSDLLYQPWLCATTPVRSEWLERDNIPRISAADLTREEFRARFEETNTPVIITGLVSCRRAPHVMRSSCPVVHCAVGNARIGAWHVPPDSKSPNNALLTLCGLQVDQWPAYRKWSKEQLAKALGSRKLLAGEFEFSLEDYFLYADHSR